ncbi:MAG: DUF971 domain-containing protein [Acidobacteriia bacterium]|jgi:DUF971 family protein|nr:DUF971 domain-containing protein [Terriglobia bacterium]
MSDPVNRFAPVNVAVIGRELAIAWADGQETCLGFDDLRRSCPCAACRARAAAPPSADPLRVVRAASAGELSIVRVVPVGSYAIQIVWSDGHDTGIYSFERLRGASGSRP